MLGLSVVQAAGKPLDWPGRRFSRPAWGRWYTRASFWMNHGKSDRVSDRQGRYRQGLRHIGKMQGAKRAGIELGECDCLKLIGERDTHRRGDRRARLKLDAGRESTSHWIGFDGAKIEKMAYTGWAWEVHKECKEMDLVSDPSLRCKVGQSVQGSR